MALPRISVLAACVMVVAICLIAGVAPTDVPTTSSHLWGRKMPDPWWNNNSLLILIGATVFGAWAAIASPRHKVAAGLVACVVGLAGLALLSALVWRIHDPTWTDMG